MKHTILYFSSIDWDWPKQRPQYLCEAMARLGAKVTYVSYNTGGKYRCGEMQSGVRVCSICGVKGYMRLGACCALGRRTIGHVLRDLTFDTVILTNPVQLWLLPDSLRALPIYYDCMDRLAEFYEGRPLAALLRSEQELCSIAEKVFVSAAILEQYLRESYGLEKAYLVRNGYSPEACCVAEKRKIRLEQPSIVYTGTIGPWFDKESLAPFFQGHPDYRLYLVGPCDEAVQAGIWACIPSAVFTGPLAHTDALAYVSAASAVVMPFQVNRLVEAVDPVKLYEYIALQKPVVSSWWPALEPFRDYVGLSFYHCAEEFEERILTMVDRRYPVPENFALRNCWEGRADYILQLLI